MHKNKETRFQLNAGNGMVLGIFVAVLVAVLVNVLAGDSSIWSWAIPVGIASGLAVGAGQANKAS